MDTNLQKFRISIGDQFFIGELYQNSTVEALKNLFPLEIKMIDLNKNEKYYDLLSNLPINPILPKQIEIGDLMLFGSNTLVLFYKRFNTSYRYTPLGRLNTPQDLAKILGEATSTIYFELIS